MFSYSIEEVQNENSLVEELVEDFHYSIIIIMFVVILSVEVLSLLRTTFVNPFVTSCYRILLSFEPCERIVLDTWP